MVSVFYFGPVSAFPGKERWRDFITLVNINKPTMLQTDDRNEDIGRTWSATDDAAKLGVKERLILYIIMQ